MNIGLFTDSFEKNDKMYNAISYLKKGLVELGHNVYIFSAGTKEQEKTKLKDVFYFTSAQFKQYPDFKIAVFPFFSTTDIAKKLKLDLIHVVGLGTMGIAGFKTAEKLKIPKIATISVLMHKMLSIVFANETFERVMNDLVYKYIKWYYSNFDHIVTPSAFADKIMTNDLNIQANSIIPYGIDYKFFSNEMAKRRFKHNFVTGGNLIKEKNIQHIINSFNSILNKHNNAKLHIFGSGNYESELKTLVKTNKIENNVLFYGNIDKEKLRALFLKTSLYLYSSNIDVQPMSLLESMAAGVIPIAIKNSFAEDILDERFIYKDEFDLPKKISDLLESNLEELRYELKEIVKDYDYQLIARRYERVYEKLI